MREHSFLEAIFTGLLVALSAVLFVEYFGVSELWNVPLISDLIHISLGLAIIDLIILFFIGTPGKAYGTTIFVVILLIIGYAAYGPYASYLRGPMRSIGEGIATIPELGQRQLYCLSLLFTNPMAYATECGTAVEQPKAPEEKPEDLGLELTNFEFPYTEIYAGSPLEITAILENKGDYSAIDVTIDVDSSEYEECGIDVFNITEKNGYYAEKINPEEIHYFSAIATVNDPWESDCKYAKNKAVIGGTMKLSYSYKYRTESYLDMDVVREYQGEKIEVRSAKEKAAPGNVLMLTTTPLIWNWSSGFRQRTIKVKFKNERLDGEIIFRGEAITGTVYLEEDKLSDIAKYWCEEICKDIGEVGCREGDTSECEKSFGEINRTKAYCLVKPIEVRIDNLDCSKIIIGYSKENECLAGIPLKDIDNETECLENGTPIYNSKGKYKDCLNKSTVVDLEAENCTDLSITQVYKVEGNYTRKDPDSIRIYLVGEQAKKYVNLVCGTQRESDLMRCKPVNDNEIVLTWKEGDQKLQKGETKLIYSGLIVNLTQGKWPQEFEEVDKFSFVIKADATYRTRITETRNLQIYNPHFTD